MCGAILGFKKKKKKEVLEQNRKTGMYDKCGWASDIRSWDLGDLLCWLFLESLQNVLSSRLGKITSGRELRPAAKHLQ